MVREIFNHLKSKWYKYVIEIVVVMVGILIAFNLEQWSEARNNKKKEIELLKEFKRGLSADLSRLQWNIRGQEYSVHSIKIILKVIQENSPYHDSLDVHFAYTHLFNTFESNSSPIEQLKNTSLTIISNDTLRAEILNLYDRTFSFIQQVPEKIIQDDGRQLRNFDKSYFESYDQISTCKSVPPPFPWGMHPIRFTELKTSVEYAAILRARISNQEVFLLPNYRRAEKVVTNLLDRIDREIKKLEK